MLDLATKRSVKYVLFHQKCNYLHLEVFRGSRLFDRYCKEYTLVILGKLFWQCYI